MQSIRHSQALGLGRHQAKFKFLSQTMVSRGMERSSQTHCEAGPHSFSAEPVSVLSLQIPEGFMGREGRLDRPLTGDPLGI